MLDAADAARRRDLQRRAYAAGGGLTAAEAAELRDLDARHTASAPPPSAGAAIPAATAPGDREFVALEGRPPPEEEVPSPPDEATASTARERPRPRIRRWMLTTAAVLAIALGFAGGWIVFGGDPDGRPMTAAQRETRADIEESGGYDPGSVEFLGEKFGASMWRAVKGTGRSECVVLSRGGARTETCRNLDGQSRDLFFGLQADLGYDEGGEHFVLWGVLAEDVNGERVGMIQRQRVSSGDAWDWRSQYSGRELAIVDRIEDAGYAGDTLLLLGHDGDLSVWTGAGDNGALCLLVVTADLEIYQECGPVAYVDSQRFLQLDVEGTTYRVDMSASRGPTLTIIRSTPDSRSIDDATERIE